MSDTELPHLETFCKAAELLSFTAAADVLCMTQAAVSQRIRALEDSVGIELFERHAGRIELTTAGMRLYEYGQRILALHREARTAIGQSAPPLTGELHLAASTVPAEHLLPDLLQDFQRRFPAVHIVATVADTEAALAALKEGRVSLALVGQDSQEAAMESTSFARDRLVLVAAPDHRWARRKHVTLEDLAAEPLILRESGSGSRACFEQGLQRLHKTIRDFRVSLELGSNEAIKEAVLRGGGVAFLSVFAVRDDLESGRLVGVPVKGLEVGRDLYVVTDRRRVLPPAARAFLEILETRPFTRA